MLGMTGSKWEEGAGLVSDASVSSVRDGDAKEATGQVRTEFGLVDFELIVLIFHLLPPGLS